MSPSSCARSAASFLSVLALAVGGCGEGGGGTGGGGGGGGSAVAGGKIEVPADPALAELATFANQRIAAGEIDRSKPDWKHRLPKPPRATFVPSKTYRWNLTTSQGPVTVRLLPKVAPMHASSLAYLTMLGFYDGLTFHRVIPGFMAQGGDPFSESAPAGDRRVGSGGPGYQFDGEFDPAVLHDKPGILSAAHSGPGTDGSQFFLTFRPTPHLDQKHTVYGETTDGLGTLQALESYGTPGGTPKRRLVIEKATITVE